MACVYATAGSSGVCCASQGDKAMTVNLGARSSTTPVKTSCFHHATEEPMSALSIISSPMSRSTSPMEAVWAEQQSLGDWHFVSEGTDHCLGQ